MVTAELAVGLLTVTLMAALLAWVVGLVGLQARCTGTAVAVARQYARGDDDGVRNAGEQRPAGAQVRVAESAGAVRVVVSVEKRWGALGPVTIEGRAQLTLEPDGEG